MAGKYGALILAGGYSSRMGTVKALLPLPSDSAIAGLIRTYRSFGVSQPLVVVGCHKERISPEAERVGARTVENPNYNLGMFSSVLAGAAAMADEPVDAFFLSPVDCPLVSPVTLAQMAAALETGAYDVVYPVYHGKKGHPPLISARCLDAILHHNGERGLKGALLQFQSRACMLTVEDWRVTVDMDTMADYEALLHKIKCTAEAVHPI